MSDIIDRAQALEEAEREEAIRRATATAPQPGQPARLWCARCGDEIEEERRKAQPGVCLCLDCQESVERSGRLFRKG